jgi:hypothetical protein
MSNEEDKGYGVFLIKNNLDGTAPINKFSITFMEYECFGGRLRNKIRAEKTFNI